MGRPPPPHSDEAEAEVIGSILLRPEKLPTVLPILKPADFFQPANAAVFEAMIECDRDGDPITHVSVEEKLRALDMLDRLRSKGGTEYLLTLESSVISPEAVGHHARVVAEKAHRRRMALDLFALTNQAFNSGISESNFFETFEKTILELSTPRSSAHRSQTLKQALKSLVSELGARYEEFKRKGGKVVGIRTGFDHFDEVTGGLRIGQQVVLAARPAMGKSAWALNAVEAAGGSGVPVYVLSAEMSNPELAERMVAANGNVDASNLRNGTLNQQEWVALSNAASRLADLPVRLDDDANASVVDLRSRVRRWRATEAAKAEQALVVVDYLQLLSPEENGDSKYRANREREVAEISRGCKAMAKESKCAVIALAQLNRQLESRADKRPMLSDLRESGAIEQDADIVMFLYRDEVYRKSTEQWANPFAGIAELIIGKHRAGECRTIPLNWDPVHTKFSTRNEPMPEEKQDNETKH
jgi:replicative DNA helicase